MKWLHNTNITIKKNKNFDYDTDGEDAIVKIVLGGTHSAAITSKGRILMWGQNKFGQLGDGTRIDRSSPIEITSGFDIFPGETIKDVFLGYNHSSAITSENRLFVWGKNDAGKLGCGNYSYGQIEVLPVELTDMRRHNRISYSETWAKLFLGFKTSLALSSESRIFAWGDLQGLLNSERVFFKEPNNFTNAIDCLLEGEKIVDIYFSHHCAIFTSLNRILFCGSNNFGQFGDGTTNDSNKLIDITANFNLSNDEIIVKASFGPAHSAALTSKGRIFTWGTNGAGQLGIGTTLNKFTPFDLTSKFYLFHDEQISDISLGVDISSALTSQGRIFTWGYNLFGQLGNGGRYNALSPKDITDWIELIPDETISSITMGDCNSAVITSKSRVFIWGIDKVKKYSDGTSYYREVPFLLE